jgi:outer membrane protein TolC
MRVVAMSLSVVLWATALFGQPTSGPPLTLRDAIAWARDHHPALDAAAARIAAARPGPEAARSLMPPMLDAQIWQWPVTSLNPADVTMYMFMLEQELPGRGKRALRAAAADRAVDSAVADAAVRDRVVVSGVELAFAALRATERETTATRRVLPAVADLVRALEVSYAAGRGSQADVVRATLAETAVRERLITLDADAARERVTLNIAMGRAPDAPIGVLEDAPPPTTIPPLEDLLDRAMRLHPELNASRAAIRVADADRAIAASERRPDWVVQGGYMLMPGSAGAWSAKVGLTWPGAPWAEHGISARTTSAAAAADAARAELETTRQEIVRHVAEARAILVGAVARLDVVRDTMRPQSAHLVEAARLAFAAGQAPLSDVLDAQQMALDTDAQVARLSGAADQAWAELESAVGADLLPLAPPSSSSAALGAQE